MTVKELRDRLEGVPDDMPVYLLSFFGFAYRYSCIEDAMDLEMRDGRRIFAISNANIATRMHGHGLMKVGGAPC